MAPSHVMKANRTTATSKGLNACVNERVQFFFMLKKLSVDLNVILIHSKFNLQHLKVCNKRCVCVTQTTEVAGQLEFDSIFGIAGSSEHWLQRGGRPCVLASERETHPHP